MPMGQRKLTIGVVLLWVLLVSSLTLPAVACVRIYFKIYFFYFQFSVSQLT